MTIATTEQHHSPSLPEQISYAKALAESNLLPKQYAKQPANVLLAMQLDEWLTTDDGISTYSVTFLDKRGGFRGSIIGEAAASAGCINVGDALHGCHIPSEQVTSVTCVGTVQL